jgi:hypothetical protein
MRPLLARHSIYELCIELVVLARHPQLVAFILLDMFVDAQKFTVFAREG